MDKKITRKEAIEVLLFLIICAFVFVFSKFLFETIFLNNDRTLFLSSISAFTGAFFAYIFTRFATGFDRVYMKKRKHREALIKYERMLIDAHNAVNTNIYVIDDFRRIVNEAASKNEKFVYFNNLHPVHIDNLPSFDLQNIDFINDLYTLRLDCGTLSSDMATINEMLAVFRDSFISGKITLETYLYNMERLSEKLVQIRIFLTNTAESIVDLSSKLVILLKEDTFLGTTAAFFRATHYTDRQKIEFNEAKIQLKKDIKKRIVANRRKLNDLFETKEK